MMRLLHISDIHFGTKLAKDGKATEVVHWFKKDGAEDPAALVQLLARSELCRSPEPDAVIVTGDLTWQAAPAEYESALTFLNHARRAWPDAKIVVVPGNHDVDVADATARAARQDRFLTLLQSFHDGDFVRLYPITDLAAADRRERMVCVEVIRDEAILVGVNSAAAMNKKDDAIFIAPAVLEHIGEHLQKIDPGRERLRILALHHHLFPFVEPQWTKSSDPASEADRADPSIVGNSAKLQEWLADNAFSIVLHGHKHTFHGRKDLLWREVKPGDHELIVIGAGSASVYPDKVPKERFHTCNVLDLEPSAQRAWHVAINTHRITQDEAVPTLRTLLVRSFEIGVRGESPWLFESDDMRRVHRAIARRCSGRKVRNFMSVVQNAVYRHPETLRIGSETATQRNVEESFAALHPEWQAGTGWLDSNQVDRLLAAQHKSYRIQHGPRMFGRLEDFDLEHQSWANALRPIHAALDALKSSETRGYLGLYNPELDVRSKRHLVPGLVGLQFLKGDQHKSLDVVATFRNLELSFWWAVNMFELIELLGWAIGRMGSDGYKRGSITIFSSFAEWRSDPRPVFVAGVDTMTTEKMLVLLMSAADGDPAARQELRGRLHEKQQLTTELNIDAVGLGLMAELARGLLRQRGTAGYAFPEGFAEHLANAARRLDDAIEIRVDRSEAVQLAKLDLDKAIAQLG